MTSRLWREKSIFRSFSLSPYSLPQLHDCLRCLTCDTSEKVFDLNIKDFVVMRSNVLWENFTHYNLERVKFYTSREKVHDDEFFNDVSVFSDLENATASSWFYEWGCFMFIFHANMKSYFSRKLFNFLLQKNYLKLIFFKIALKLIFAPTNFKEGSHKNDMIFTYKKCFINNFKAHFKTTSSSSRRGSTDYWLRMRMEMLWTKKKIVPCRISFASLCSWELSHVLSA